MSGAAEELTAMSQTIRRKPPVRTTVPVPTNIRPDLLDCAKAEAQRAGFRSLRAYLEALIAQGLVDDDSCQTKFKTHTRTISAVYPSSIWAIGPSVLAHRTVVALEALAERTRADEHVEALRADLMSLRWEIGQHLLELRADYDREVAARDVRHYARFGTADE